MPIEQWLATFWSRGQLFGLLHEPRDLIDPAACSALWHQIVGRVTDLAVPERARVAALAEDAWLLAVRYGFPMQQLSALAMGDDNLALFASCATRMNRRLRECNALTRAELPGALLAHGTALASILPARIVLTPSFSSDPALQQLWNGFRELGVVVEAAALDGTTRSAPEVSVFADHTQEMNAALDWAATELARSADASVAIIVPDLAMNRSVWLRGLRVRFNSEAWWRDPSTDRDCFNISVGDTLATVPHIASLLTLLRADSSEQDTEVLAQALLHSRWGRSPHSQRDIAHKQRDLLERGMDRSVLADWKSIPALASAIAASETRSEREQSRPVNRSIHCERLQQLIEALTESPWLMRTDLFQLDEAWSALLDRWQQFDQWLAPLPWNDALSELERLAGQSTFQPKAGIARLQVMGLLESAGVPLDAARIVGLHDRVLPERLKPHPMLPRSWQTEKRIGLGAQDEVDERATRLWKNWLDLCGSLTVSFAREHEGTALRLSPLVQVLPANQHRRDTEWIAPVSSPQRQFVTETTSDEHLPPRDATPGGKSLSARALEDQAHCPRRAAASRLGLKEWPEHAVGIPARVRGTLVHAVLAAVGAARMRAHEAAQPSPSDDVLLETASDALDIGIKEQSAMRLRVAPMVWQIERSRVMALVEKVLKLEHTRTGFAVVAVESDTKARVFEQDFRVRVDRVDQLVSDDHDRTIRVVFDYKTGRATRSDWFAEGTSGRLAAPQLPLYALILSQSATSAPVRALGYIVVGDDEEPKFVGVGEDKTMGASRSAKNDPSWDTLTASWDDQLAQLVTEVQRGIAEVAPLKGQGTCRYCSFGSFCREPWSLASARSDAVEFDAPGAAAGTGDE